MCIERGDEAVLAGLRGPITGVNVGAAVSLQARRRG